MEDPEGLESEVQDNKIIIKGIDKEKVGQYAACLLYTSHMCADTDFIEKKENIVIYCVFIKRPQCFIENNEILRLILF